MTDEHDRAGILRFPVAIGNLAGKGLGIGQGENLCLDPVCGELFCKRVQPRREDVGEAAEEIDLTGGQLWFAGFCCFCGQDGGSKDQRCMGKKGAPGDHVGR